ncbi:MAG TPA: site-specific DNA-methyltransferase [Solirubrobacterales bacterium]|jgi:DNA modification methylase
MASTPNNDDTSYGPSNPHPLSQLQTELVWEGKYDAYGNRRTVDGAGLAMPMQRIETIDEPRARTEAQGDLFDTGKSHLDDFRNRLIWGDNKLVLASLLSEFKGSLDLIYIDPPFDVGSDFSATIALGDEEQPIEKEQSAMEVVAYRDTWGRGTDSYIHMMYERLVLLRDLLADSGSICVHCDWHASHLLKMVLTDVFGRSNFRNEIVWWYYNKMQGNTGQFASNHDVVLWFSKSSNFKHKPIREARDKPKRQQKRAWDPVTKSLKQARDEKGDLVYYMETERTLDDVWRLPYLMPADRAENEKFETQKPVELVGRFIDAFTDPGDLVMDAFCGSGSTLVAAEGLRAKRVADKKSYSFTDARRWIGIDLSRFPIHLTRKRLLEMQRQLHGDGKAYRAFDVFNLGRYERQWWQKELLKGADDEHRRIVLEFFKAEILANSPSPHLHGRKGAAFCHVDSIDSIFTRDEAKTVGEAASDAGAKEVYCLAWEFEMDLRIECDRLEKELETAIKLIQIPREIMEKNRKEPPPFLEVATLGAEPVFHEENGKKSVDIRLTSFIPSLSEIPTSELDTLKDRAMKSGFDFIDFWAVDFDFTNGSPFHHDWQDYRLRKDRSLKTTSEQRYVYGSPGTYTACIKVVDIFGCDTSITVDIPYG